MLDRLTQIIMLCAITALIPAAYALNRSLAFGAGASGITAAECEFVDAFMEMQRSFGFTKVVFNARTVSDSEIISTEGGLGELGLGEDLKVVVANAAPIRVSECGIPVDLIVDLQGKAPPQPYDVAEDWDVPVISLGRAIQSRHGERIIFEYISQPYDPLHGYWPAVPFLFEARSTDDGRVFKELKPGASFSF